MSVFAYSGESARMQGLQKCSRRTTLAAYARRRRRGDRRQPLALITAHPISAP